MPSTDSRQAPVIVVAAVIRDDAGKILLTRRPEGRHMGGLWEFPGGKVKDGESPAAGLVRELEEELALSARIGVPLTFAVHEEPAMRIILLFYDVAVGRSEPRPLEGQKIAWVAREDLRSYPTPPADAKLIELLIGDPKP
jgi:8-oxo-dGTP diphosphatase